MGRAKVISFINYKGGVAKTTTTYHVGCSLVQHYNKRVLMIDIDPQTNLTFLCAPIGAWERFKQRSGTISNLYRRHLEGKSLDTKRFIWREPVGSAMKQGVKNLDLIPCDIDLIGEDLAGGDLGGSFGSFDLVRRSSKKFVQDRSFLRNVVRDVEDDYDYVLIDCPPNLYLMTQNALAASRWYVVTAIPDHLSTIGLRILVTKAQKVGDMLGSAQELAGGSRSVSVGQLGGIVFVRVRLGASVITNVHRDTMDDVAKRFPGLPFGDYTTELIGYGEAAEQMVPVWMLDTENARRAASRQEYERITREFLTRFP